MTGDQSRLLKPLALANARDAVKALIVAKRVLGIGSLRTDAGCFAPLYARKVQDLHGVSTMAEITYYVALPFLFTDDGILLGDAVECPSASTAIVRAEIMARKTCNAGAIAFCRNCNPDTGAFGDPIVLKKFGDVPDDLSTL